MMVRLTQPTAIHRFIIQYQRREIKFRVSRKFSHKQKYIQKTR